MHITNEIIRLPDEYRKPISERSRKKWDKIISLFFESRLSDLALNHRTGTRGRILSVLALKVFNIMQIPFNAEPIFYHTEPNRWYTEFTQKHEIKLRTHDFYNPDLFLEDGTWVEITLSENTAYQKLFRYGHQAENLLLLWLDNDDGFHKKTCRHIRFPNARIESIERFDAQLKKTPNGLEIIDKIEVLKDLKGTIL
jgi:hypothetical protein